MSYKKILTIQDISCVGQCSLTVALPILSAAGHETCILPSAVLSTHTAGFSNYTFRDLTDDIPAIKSHWLSEKITFDAFYTGYLGSTKQIAFVKDILFGNLRNADTKTIVDPAMADNGKLYPGFDNEFVEAMKSLAFSADIILPNITEACMLTGYEYRETYDEKYIDGLLEKLAQAGAKCVVLTGVGFTSDKTGVIVFENGTKQYYEHERISKGCHGTGDVYAASFVGALLNGKTKYESAKIAADFTLKTIKNTIGDTSHWYGVKFEPVLGEYIKMLG